MKLFKASLIMLMSLIYMFPYFSSLSTFTNNKNINKRNLYSSNKRTLAFTSSLSEIKNTSETFYKNLKARLEKLRQDGAKRIENSSWISLGYNVAYGNPILSPENGKLIDAGLTTAIFKQSFVRNNITPDGLYIYPDGYEIMPAKVCKTNFSSQIMQSSSELKSSMSLSLGAEGGFGPISFSANTEYKKMSEAMNSEDKTYISNQATCSTYRAVLNLFNPPEISMNFIKGVETISNKTFTENTKEIFFNFIDTFGTHFLYDIMMGSRYTYVEETTKKSMNELKSEGLNISAEAKYSAMSSINVKSSLQNSNNQSSKYENSITNKFVTSVGAPMPASMDMKEWLSGSSVLPMPISYSLKQITKLFEIDSVKMKLKESNINAEEIRTSLVKTMENYCSHLLSKKAVKTCATDIPNPTTKRYIFTKFTDNGNGNIFYLDRQDVTCANSEAINYIKMESGDKQLRYKIVCVKSDSISDNCLNKETTPNDVNSDKEKSLVYLDRHTIECDEGYVLRGFTLKRNNDKIFYKYNCCKAGVKNTFEITSGKTSVNDQKIYHLSLQEIDGKDNNVIKKFKLNAANQMVFYTSSISTLK